MKSDLDKYGLVALTIIVVLILFIAVSDLQDDKQERENLNAVRLTDLSDDKIDYVEPDDEIVIVDEEELDSQSSDFNFDEDPIDYAGDSTRRDDVIKNKITSERFHTIRNGDTLSSISKKYFGDSNEWRKIIAENPGLNPRVLSIGKKIVIPGSSSRGAIEGHGSGGAARRADSSSPEADKKTTRYHKVRKGETLDKIARRYYRDANKWKKIMNANKVAISDPKKLRIGAKLRIPF